MLNEHLTLPDGTIAYDLTGPTDGLLVVCVHGLGDTRASYRFLAATLAEAGYRVATMDVRGHGDSSVGWPEYSTPAVAEDITALIRHLGGPAIVIGHSFAAGSAAVVATRYPELVSRLVMLGPAVDHRPPGFFLKQAAKLVTSNATLWAIFYKSLYPGAKPPDFKEYLQALKASLRRPGRMAAVKDLMASLTPETDADLSTVAIPTVILMGGKDGDFSDPIGEAHRIAASLAGPAEVHVLPASGHYPQADAPEATGAIIVEYLAA